MKQDLITQYRPKTFEDFWTSCGVVEEIQAMLEAQALSLGIILAGSLGMGKTSMALLIGQVLACRERSGLNPCYACEGCRMVQSGYFGFDTRLVINGGSPDMDELKRFCWQCVHYIAPWPDRHCVIVMDETHDLTSRQQAEILPLMESTPGATFIFCTTRLDKVDAAIRARSQEFEMALPTEEEAARALLRIALREGIPLLSSDAQAIARKRNCIPRDCLKDLQRRRGRVRK